MAGLFHAAASLGIAESADQIARRGLAARINGDARPRMQVADNAIDLAAARADPVARGRADRRAPRRQPHVRRDAPNELGGAVRRGPGRQGVRRRGEHAVSSTARWRSRAAPATSTAVPSRAPTATSRPAPSCTHWAPTAPTTTSPTSRSANSRRSTDMAPASSSRCSRRASTRTAFREALGRFATGVAFVTAAPDGEPAGPDRQLADLGLPRAAAGRLLPRPQFAHVAADAAGRTLRRKRARSAARRIRPPRRACRRRPVRRDRLGVRRRRAYRCSPTRSPRSSARSSPSTAPAITGSWSGAWTGCRHAVPASR